jgi:hypothetical protein
VTVTDYYSRHPHRLREALERGELSFEGFGLASFFIDKIAASRSDRVAFTLTVLAHAVGWKRGQEQLRRELHRLREDEWLDFKVTGGQRKPWVFTLKKADHHLTSTSPPLSEADTSGGQVEVTSTELRWEDDASPQPEGHPAYASPPPGGGPKEVEVDVDVEEDQNLPRDGSAAAVGGEPYVAESALTNGDGWLGPMVKKIIDAAEQQGSRS